MERRRLWMVSFDNGAPNIIWTECMMGLMLNVWRTSTINGWSARKVGKSERGITKPQATLRQRMW